MPAPIEQRPQAREKTFSLTFFRWLQTPIVVDDFGCLVRCCLVWRGRGRTRAGCPDSDEDCPGRVVNCPGCGVLGAVRLREWILLTEHYASIGMRQVALDVILGDEVGKLTFQRV